nr:unnamed protein product [Callosobruchus chinensis]
MDDNARPHHTRAVQQALENGNIARLEWPVMSPDIDPIEHVWGYVSRAIFNRNNPPRSTQELIVAATEECELRRRRKEEALARGEKILSRSERRRQWEAKLGARKNPPTSEAGSSGTQGAGVASTHSTSSEAQPSTSGQSSHKGKRLYSQRTSEEAAIATKRTRTEVGTMRPPESFADKVTVEKMPIVHLNHPETRLSKETALKIKMELGRRAIRGKDVRITSCYPENGAVVVGCVNTHTKSWLETQFKQLDPFKGIQLKLGPARSLVRMCKVTTFVPRTAGAETKDDVMLGLKSQSGLDTDHWAVVGGNTTPEGQLLVIHVDGRRRSSYLEVVQEEGRQVSIVQCITQFAKNLRWDSV